MVEIIYPATGVHVFTRDELLETYLKRGFVLADQPEQKPEEVEAEPEQELEEVKPAAPNKTARKRRTTQE